MELIYGLAVMGILMLGSLLTSKISSFLNLPCLLLFLGIGMLFSFGWLIQFDYTNTMDVRNANYIGTASMAFILFSGGFDTDWKAIKPVFVPGGILSSLGVLLTALFTGCFLYGLCKLVLFPNITFAWCLLLGSVISSTDAAAVFSILRSRSVSLQGRIQPLLEFESGSNDPMAAFLTVFMIEIVTLESTNGAVPWTKYGMIIPWFLLKMSVGVVFGYLMGRIFVWLYNRINFEYDGLYYVLGVVIVLLSFSLTECCQGNGFMAVYVTGIVMGNSRFVFHNGVGRFFDGLAWMMQVILFTMLGLLVTPSNLCTLKVLAVGLAVALFLMIVSRPLATFLCSIHSQFNFREKLLISWVGLRGGAPIMLATFPLLYQVTESQFMFNIVFFIVLTSVLLQGMTIMPMARLLHLDAPLHKVARTPLVFEETGDTSSESKEVIVSASFSGMTLSQLKLPEGTLVLLIRREEKFLIPRGDTQLRKDDVLTLMGTKDSVRSSLEMFAKRSI